MVMTRDTIHGALLALLATPAFVFAQAVPAPATTSATRADVVRLAHQGKAITSAVDAANPANAVRGSVGSDPALGVLAHASSVSGAGEGASISALTQQASGLQTAARELADGRDWQGDARAKRDAALASDGSTITRTAKEGRRIVTKALAEASKTYDLPPAVSAAATSKPPPVSIRYKVFVSQSLGDAGLHQAITMAIAHPSVMLVLRGVKKGQTLGDLYKLIAAAIGHALRTGDRIPNIEIDPPAFTDAHVSVAPTIVAYDAKGKPQAQVRGLLDPGWIKAAIADGNVGDLGKKGATYPIVEQNMLDVFRAKAKAFDWAGWKKRQLANFWKHQHFVPLPTARVARVRYVDPTVVVTRDMRLPDGTYFARKGDTYNPMKSVGFHQTLVIFDETDPAQVAYAAAYAKARPDSKITLITTQVDPSKGWKGYRAIQNAVDRRVFVLGKDVRTTFHIERVPTVVTADMASLRFVITEVPMSEEVAHADVKTSKR